MILRPHGASPGLGNRDSRGAPHTPLKGRAMAQSHSTDLTPTSVYRYFDRDGILLYVGITGRGMSRNSEHNKSKDWWPYVTRQEVDHCKTRRAALNLERETIRQFRPPFNTQHNPGSDETRAIYLAHRDGPAMSPAAPIVAATSGRRRLALNVRAATPKVLILTSRAEHRPAVATLDVSRRDFDIASGGMRAVVDDMGLIGGTLQIVLRLKSHAHEVDGAEMMLRLISQRGGRHSVKRIELLYAQQIRGARRA